MDLFNSLPIYKALLADDWESAEPIFTKDTSTLNTKITKYETPLHMAVGTNCSHRFVEKLVERIISVDKDQLLTVGLFGNNVLHYAAKAGNTTDSRLLVSKYQGIAQIPNDFKNTALQLAAWYGHKDTLCCLLEETDEIKDIEGGKESPYTGCVGADLIGLTIIAGFYDVALYLVENYPSLATKKDIDNKAALEKLAAKPDAFPSGNQLLFWQQFIYSWVPVNHEKAFAYPVKKGGKANNFIASLTCRNKAASNALMKLFNKVLDHINFGLWGVLQYLVPKIKHIHDMKVTHMQTQRILEKICSEIIKKECHSAICSIFEPAVSVAVKYGIHEIIEACIQSYPPAFWCYIDGVHFSLAAIMHRHEKVYNLIYQMSAHKVIKVAEKNPAHENALHIAGRLAPPQRLKTITCAALQMQRELQWFKEVEKFVAPSFREALNNEGNTPKMVFRKAHEKLVQEGQQWLKDTSSSCTVVAALIVTVAFAAAFTVAGGNNSDGIPLFLKDRLFILFAIANAISLFSSATSVLMFLAILTSRFAEEDFLYSLPKKLTIGLLSLFLSLAAMMIAFSATLALSLRSEITWIAVPVTLIACIPVTLFAFLQFPLLVELVLSTYGPSIFHKQNNTLLH